MKLLIWSNEHGCWWGPGRRGYVRIIARAGRYSPPVAEAICRDANKYLPEGQEPNEVAVMAPEWLWLAGSENSRPVAHGEGKAVKVEREDTAQGS
jgi:hypothetical protein